MIGGLNKMNLKKVLDDVLSEKKHTDPSLKPPKEWFNKMKAEIRSKNPDYSDEQVSATVGSIWYKKMKKSDRKETREAEGKKYGKAPKKD